MSDKMREAFERWAKSECIDTDSVDGFYSDNDTHIAWGSWQAAQSAAVPVVGDVVALLAEVPFRFLQKGMVTVVKPNKPEFIEEDDISLYRRPTTSITADELDALQVAARALKALLDRDLSYVDNVVYFTFESHTQAINHIIDARNAANAAIAGEKKHG